ncbi:exodeoxyribonuclease III [Synechococcus sp. PCC 7336]|uniref:exodeoxyribonuclease III n=1 Tax=Synechococcus sp. PCC 7336 TaxID=195250 RepID=UPI0003479133|nr:exodeoxyribonuclease III [Synechococcus sp. PCC 7336]
MQIATWNVNSIRTRLAHIQTWLDSDAGAAVDVLCLQETKVIDKQFPLEPLQAMGLYPYIYGQKAYNGVAFISRHPLAEVTCGFEPVVGKAVTGAFDEQKRVISAVLRGVRIVNLYVPNGSEVGSEKYQYKLGWFEVLQEYLKTYLAPEGDKTQMVVCGDFNIALEDRDIYNPDKKETHIMSSRREREVLRQVLALGLQDTFRKFTEDGGHFSWWDYRSGGFARNRGWRIDHLYATPRLYERAVSCTIDRDPRSWKKPSDHAPVVLELAEE